MGSAKAVTTAALSLATTSFGVFFGAQIPCQNEADGMAEEIITALSRCASLFVIARNSSFAYKGRSIDVRQVGRELGVRFVVDGSVRRNGDRVRFTSQLIDSSSGAHLWAARFDRELTDVFSLQDRITENADAQSRILVLMRHI